MAALCSRSRMRPSHRSYRPQEPFTNFDLNLQVPLNYSDPQGREATIALMRLQAAVPSTSDAYRGPILFNPGGPGGSGVGTVLRAGELLQKIVGPEFDIVGFDPRGKCPGIYTTTKLMTAL